MLLSQFPVEVSGGSSVAIPNSFIGPTVTQLAGLEPPRTPMSAPAIAPTFPGSVTGPASLGVGQTPEVLLAGVPTPVSTPPMGCSKCGAPAIVATAVPVSSAPVVQMAPQLPSSADLAALFDKLPWWVWVIVAILALRGLLK